MIIKHVGANEMLLDGFDLLARVEGDPDWSYKTETYSTGKEETTLYYQAHFATIVVTRVNGELEEKYPARNNKRARYANLGEVIAAHRDRPSLLIPIEMKQKYGWVPKAIPGPCVVVIPTISLTDAELAALEHVASENGIDLETLITDTLKDLAAQQLPIPVGE